MVGAHLPNGAPISLSAMTQRTIKQASLKSKLGVPGDSAPQSRSGDRRSAPVAALGAARNVLMLALWLIGAGAGDVRGAGVTLITHGNSGNTDGWVTGMANALSQRLGGNIPIYRIDVTNGTGGYGAFLHSASGGNPLSSGSGEIILKVDWRNLANTSHTTYSVANALAPVLSQANFIPQLGGHALAEFPLHIMGHSRGGSLVCELSQRLGEAGLWVDQVTTLDAYPIGGDAPALGYENVFFAEGYYQTDYLFFDGQFIPNAHRRRQTTASGGYTLFSDWHSDVHLWYHGTIDLAPTASDTEVQFNSSMRDTWWAAVEQKGTNAGFIYTRLGGGDRLSNLQPNGADSSPIRDGINRNFELGAGIAANRTTLMFNIGDWPNVIKLNLLNTNSVSQGESAGLQIHFQWAQSAALTQTVQVFLDPDSNPLNGNEHLALTGTAPGTTASQIGFDTINVPLNVTNAPAGNYQVAVKLTANGRSRWLYAPTKLHVTISSTQPLLDIQPLSGGVLVGVNGVAGQTVILQSSGDVNTWQPVATNLLNTARWEIPISTSAMGVFYRAILQP